MGDNIHEVELCGVLSMTLPMCNMQLHSPVGCTSVSTQNMFPKMNSKISWNLSQFPEIEEWLHAVCLTRCPVKSKIYTTLMPFLKELFTDWDWALEPWQLTNQNTVFISCYFREFRESEPHKNFHFNLCLFIATKTSTKLWN